MEDRIIDLIALLKDKTSKDNVKWEKTGSTTNQYRTVLGKGAISIDKWVPPGTSEKIDFLIFNSEGSLIKNYMYETSEPEGKILENLHSLIVNKSLKVDDTLDSIFDELA